MIEAVKSSSRRGRAVLPPETRKERVQVYLRPDLKQLVLDYAARRGWSSDSSSTLIAQLVAEFFGEGNGCRNLSILDTPTAIRIVTKHLDKNQCYDLWLWGKGAISHLTDRKMDDLFFRCLSRGNDIHVAGEVQEPALTSEFVHAAQTLLERLTQPTQTEQAVTSNNLGSVVLNGVAIGTESPALIKYRQDAKNSRPSSGADLRPRIAAPVVIDSSSVRKFLDLLAAGSYRSIVLCKSTDRLVPSIALAHTRNFTFAPGEEALDGWAFFDNSATANLLESIERFLEFASTQRTPSAGEPR